MGFCQAGVSFMLCIMAVVALCIAVVYLQAATLHEREIKISVRVLILVSAQALSRGYFSLPFCALPCVLSTTAVAQLLLLSRSLSISGNGSRTDIQ